MFVLLTLTLVLLIVCSFKLQLPLINNSGGSSGLGDVDVIYLYETKKNKVPQSKQLKQFQFSIQIPKGKQQKTKINKPHLV